MGTRHHVAATTIGRVEAVMLVRSPRKFKVPLLLLVASLTLVFRILLGVWGASVARDALEVACLQV